MRAMKLSFTLDSSLPYINNTCANARTNAIMATIIHPYTHIRLFACASKQTQIDYMTADAAAATAAAAASAGVVSLSILTFLNFIGFLT